MKTVKILRALPVIVVVGILPSCKKENPVTTTAASVQSSKTFNCTQNLAFSKTIVIPAKNTEEGSLALTVGASDEAALNNYLKKFENVTVSFVESELLNTSPQPQSAGETEENTGVAVHFDWSNYTFNFEKGKLYALTFGAKDDSKAWINYYTVTGIVSYSTTSGFGAVAVDNTFHPYYIGCLCHRTINTAYWSWRNSSGSEFYGYTMNYNDHMEVRTFTDSYTVTQFGYFFAGSTKVYYNHRLNFSGLDVPYGYVDVNQIFSGHGTDMINSGDASGNVTFYIAG